MNGTELNFTFINVSGINVDFNKSNIGPNDSAIDNCSYSFSDSQHQFEKTGELLNTIVAPVLLLIGIPGNILTLMVIFRQRKNITSTAIFLFMLAVSDAIFLVIGTLIDWLSLITEFHIRSSNIFVCKLTMFLYVTSAHFSPWILIMITIERIICITQPHRYKRICSTLFSKVSGLTILLALVLLNSHHLYGQWNPDENALFSMTKCGPISDEPYLTFYLDFWPWIDLSVYFAIPFVVLVVGNTIILARLIQINNAKNVSHRQHTGSLTLLVVGLNVVFLVSITPLCLFLATEMSLSSWRDEVLCDDQAEYKYRKGVVWLLFLTTLCLSYINPSVNFILYVLSGVKFRNEVKAIVLCKPIGKDNAFAP